MKLLTYSDGRQERLGALVGSDEVVDLVALADSQGATLPGTMLGFIAAGEDELNLAARLLAGYHKRHGDGIVRHLATVNLLAPIPRPTKNVVGVALNYLDHVSEGNRARGESAEAPAAPIFFTKPPLSVIGPDHEIPLDRAATSQLDYEGELAVIIGRSGRNISQARALDYVFGYTVGNDISARDLQRKHQITKGKSLDGSCPIGPWIVTTDEVTNARELEIVTKVNAEERQRAKVGLMIHDTAALISALSLGQTLEPGDIILTGTPAGVGFAMQPPRLLEDGDIIEISITGIGTLRNRVTAR